MTIELIPITYQNCNSYAALDHEHGTLNIPFTQFIIWLVLNKNVRDLSRTVGNKPTSGTLRQYCYILKNWYDWIDEWNNFSTINNMQTDVISWDTAKNSHFTTGFLKSKRDTGVEIGTLNSYRTVLKLFYEDFCEFMNYGHLMTGLSTLDTSNTKHNYETDNILSGYQSNKFNSRKRKAVQESSQEITTVDVTNYDDISLLLKNFEDPVYRYITFLLFTSGFRITPASQLPYPGSDPENNPYLTDPHTLANDFNITDIFEIKYKYKGHEHIDDLYTIDYPLSAWEFLWVNYKPILDDRVKLWRKESKRPHNKDKVLYQGRFPKSFWLTDKGKPVTPSDIQKAFRETIKKIRKQKPGFPKITPRHLRNTYACALIKSYAELEGLSLDITDKASLELIHAYAQDQLGHKNRKTTLRYIRTINKKIRRRWLPKITPTMLPDGRIIGPNIHQDDLKKLINDSNLSPSNDLHTSDNNNKTLQQGK